MALYTGSIDCLQKIYNKYGMKGIYKATTATMYREFLAFGNKSIIINNQ